MADWGAWKNSSHGGDLLAYYNSCSQRSPSLYNNLCVNGSFSSPVFSLSPSKPEPSAEFCTQDTVDQCASILNQEVVMLGLTSVYGEAETVDLCALINACHGLVLLHQRSARDREDLEARYHRSLSDLDQSQTLHSRLKSDCDNAKRQLAQFQEKERQTVTKNRTLTAKLKSEKEETKRLQSVLNSRDLQYKHDIKKRERETNKLKERLHQVLMDKKHEKQIGMNIVNAVQRKDGRRGTWQTGTTKQEEEMYRAVISNYEDKQQTLMLENAKLRDTLHSMQSEISSLLSQQTSPVKSSIRSDSPEASLSCSDDDVSEAASETSVQSTDKISDGLYQMPYDMVQKEIEKNFHDTCLMLKEVVRHSKKKKYSGSDSSKKSSKEVSSDLKLSSTPVSNGSHSHDNVEELVNKLNKFKWIVKEQEELIQQSLQNQSQSVEKSFLHDSQLLQDKEALAEERRRLNEEKARFEEERKQLTEAAIRLGRERKDLDDEKSIVLQQQFLKLSPFASESERSLLLKSSKSNKENSRLLPPTPSFTASPTIMVTPAASGSDLYRVMGLSSGSPSKKGSVRTKPPISPQVTKAPGTDSSGALTLVDAVFGGSSPTKRKSGSSGPSHLSPGTGTSVDAFSHSLDSLKKTLFNRKPARSNSRQSLN